MKEMATSEKIDAMYRAFSQERLRWLIGKGDLLVQKGEMEMKHLEALIEKTVQDEFERSMILGALGTEAMTISQLAKSVSMHPSDVFKNIIALTKWNKIEVIEQRGSQYVYCASPLDMVLE